MLEIRNVSHRYANADHGSDRPVLDDVTFSVREGEFISLIGPSGCGKTTVLNMIAGFVAPTAGEVRLAGVPVDGIQRRKVAFMFATDNLFPWRTAEANVRLPLELNRRLSPSAQLTEARELLRRVGLAGFERYAPASLSQGMRQRVALARTLATDAPIILMDEPFGALDAQTRMLMQDEFSALWEATRKTVVLVTHDLTEAIALSDRVIVMSARPGRVRAEYEIALPRPRVILDLPANPEFERLFGAIWSDLRHTLREAPVEPE